MLLREPGRPLEPADLPMPRAGEDEVLVRIDCCAVCRTDLHVVDGELEDPSLPLVPGHQIVGTDMESGVRVGIPWLGWTCGACRYCSSGRENLCDRAKFTGYTIDGGYAEYAVASRRYCFPLPDDYSSEEAAPLLCAGLIGYRSYRMAGEVESIGLYGFGSSAQIVAQIARADGKKVFAFTRVGDTEGQTLAMEMGASWAGPSTDDAPEPLDAAIVFAPAGPLVVAALRQLAKGGSVICAGIHMSDIPAFPYSLLWGERTIQSVANLTREDGLLLFERLQTLTIRTRRTSWPLERANEALAALRSGELTGTAILEIG